MFSVVATAVLAAAPVVASASFSHQRGLLKNSVDERFDRSGSRSAWRKSAERGEFTDGAALYTSFDATPEELAVLARALLASAGRSLALLPAGRASIRAIGVRRLVDGSRAEILTLYAIHGLQLAPSYIRAISETDRRRRNDAEERRDRRSLRVSASFLREAQ